MADKPVSAGLMPVQQARQHILADAQRKTTTVQRVNLRQADGRVLAEDVFSPIDVPPWDNSAMDGYAVIAQSAKESTVLPVSQRIPAGVAPQPLRPGTAARIFTGAPLPEGADAVIMQENCSSLEDGRIRINQAPSEGENVRSKGNDIAKGSLLLRAGRRLTPLDLSVAAAVGLDRLTVVKGPVVAVLNTGDELVEPGNALRPGQIYNSNAVLIRAMLERMGLTVIESSVVRDNREETASALLQAARKAQVVITTGGVSAGEEDHVRDAVADNGQLDIWKLALKPGKPFAYGHIGDALFFGLPGNPVSAFVSFALLVRPALLCMLGRSDTELPWTLRSAGFELTTGEREEYLRVSLESADTDRVVPYRTQSSGASSSLSHADGLAVVAPHSTVTKGSGLRFVAFDDIF